MDKKIRVKYSGGREGENGRLVHLFWIFPILCLATDQTAFTHPVIGSLKGFDPLLNLVLDDTEELLRGLSCNGVGLSVGWGFSKPDEIVLLTSMLVISPTDPEDPTRTTGATRQLGLVVCRGTALVLISPVDGTEEIANPFVQQE